LENHIGCIQQYGLLFGSNRWVTLLSVRIVGRNTPEARLGKHGRNSLLMPISEAALDIG